jgi:NAD(P)H-dependent FMN reductase
MGQYSKPHTKVWAAKIGSYDGFVFVTPEYNHGISGALKNAIDFLFAEWNDKAAGFVGYGSAGGVRAVESLRLVMGEIKIADVRSQVMLSLFSDFENYTTFKPGQQHEKSVTTMLDEVVSWSAAGGKGTQAGWRVRPLAIIGQSSLLEEILLAPDHARHHPSPTCDVRSLPAPKQNLHLPPGRAHCGPDGRARPPASARGSECEG